MSTAEEWVRRRRKAKTDPIAEFSEAAGATFASASPASSDWTVVPVVAGEAGRVRAIPAKRVSREFWRRIIDDPFKDGESS